MDEVETETEAETEKHVTWKDKQREPIFEIYILLKKLKKRFNRQRNKDTDIKLKQKIWWRCGTIMVSLSFRLFQVTEY